MKIIQQGAEAIIYLNKDQVIKKRVKKGYRIPILDERIRKLRTRNESKLLKKASEVTSIPKVINEDEKTKEIILEFVDGLKLSDNLDDFDLKKQKETCKQIGKAVSEIHRQDIIHGDLTTSNMILKAGEIYLIDFGLGFRSHKFEDKAVDLHVLKQALEARHFQHWKVLFNEIEKAYKDKTVLERLKKVEKRGRYKH